MKQLTLIIAVVALVIGIWALVDAHTALSRIEQFGLVPHPVSH